MLPTGAPPRRCAVQRLRQPADDPTVLEQRLRGDGGGQLPRHRPRIHRVTLPERTA